MIKLKTGASDIGVRADIVLTEALPAFTRSSLSDLFHKHLVLANGKPIKASYKVKPNDKLEADISALTARPPAIKLPVLYEDDDVVVINKPSGILTHSKGALNLEATVASWLDKHIKKPSHATKRPFPRLSLGNREGIVHRLDRGTSGVIITAKNDKAKNWLQKLFSNRQVKKTYIAIVAGVPQPEEAIIDAPIGRNPKKPQSFKVTSQGKSAQTQYKVIKIIKSSKYQGSPNGSFSIVEFIPRTGRTHQIRIHAAYTGHPIVGDPVYGKLVDNEQMYLHAKSLELRLPGGQLQKFTAATPTKFREFLKYAK